MWHIHLANLGKTFNVVLWKAPVGFTGHIYRQLQSSFKCWYQLLSKEIHTVSFVQTYVVTLNCGYVQKNTWKFSKSCIWDRWNWLTCCWVSLSWSSTVSCKSLVISFHSSSSSKSSTPSSASLTWINLLHTLATYVGAANISHICRYKAWWWLYK